MTTPGHGNTGDNNVGGDKGDSVEGRQQAAKDMLDDLIAQSGAESTGEEYEIVDALAEGTEDSPVEITESGSSSTWVSVRKMSTRRRRLRKSARMS